MTRHQDCTLASEEAYSDWCADVDALLREAGLNVQEAWESDGWREAWESGEHTRDAVRSWKMQQAAQQDRVLTIRF